MQRPWYHPRRLLASTQLTAISLAAMTLTLALSLGRLDVSGTLWFQALEAVLVVNGAVCTVTRLPRLARRIRRDPLRVSGTLAVHLGLLLLLTGLILSSLAAWHEITPALAAGQMADLTHEALRVRCDGLQLLRDPVRPPAQAGPGGPGETGRLRDVRASLAVLAGDAVLASGPVRVGEPLTVRGISFHLHGYVMSGAEPAAIVQAVYDPGFLPAVAGAALGTVGAALALWARPLRPGRDEETNDGD